jgi:general secretion pathway protein H
MPTLQTGERNGERGFTLLELAVVFVVLGLVLVAVTQVVHRPSPLLTLKLNTDRVATALREARSLAIRDNQETPVVFDLSGRTLRIASDETERALDRDLSIALYTATSELEGRGVGSIRFFPDGTSTGGRVTLTAGANRTYVLVEWLTGRVAIEQ